jgi:hypothetical protein
MSGQPWRAAGGAGAGGGAGVKHNLGAAQAVLSDSAIIQKVFCYSTPIHNRLAAGGGGPDTTQHGRYQPSSVVTRYLAIVFSGKFIISTYNCRHSRNPMP